MEAEQPSKSDIKQTLIGLYLVIGLLVALYQTFFGHDHHGFFYHLGMGLVWPAVIFPGVGKIIALVLIVGLIAVSQFM